MVDQELLRYLQTYLSDNRRQTFERVLNSRTRHFTVVLEDIYQKHNTSAVVRSCDVFGVQDLHIIENKYKSYVSNQVAKGAHKWINFYHYNQLEHNNEHCIKHLKEQGYRIIATTPHNDSCLLNDFDISQKAALIMGVEKEGVSDSIMNVADGFLKIPMVGFTESLNISVATAIILQELSAKLRDSKINWQLSEEEKNELRLDWCKKSINKVDQIISYYKIKRHGASF